MCASCCKFVLLNLLAQIMVTPDIPTPRMLWEDCDVVPSQQLLHVLCGAGA